MLSCGSVMDCAEEQKDSYQCTVFSFFLCVAIEIDGVLHSLKDPLLKIYIHLVYKQSSVLFSWSLLISVLPEIQYILSTHFFFLSVEQHIDFTATF